MKKNFSPNQRHLTLSDRIYIEQEISQDTTFKDIAIVLHKDPSTISKEIKKNIVISDHSAINIKRPCRTCTYYRDCNQHHLCGSNICQLNCYKCTSKNPTDICIYYKKDKCTKLTKPPYVCNGCSTRNTCQLPHQSYSATSSQKNYEKLLVSSRTGINMTPYELSKLNGLISPLILKGQPLSHIFAVHADEIPVCRRTLYNYLDQRVFQARNIDLPRRVRYKRRKKTNSTQKRDINQVYRNKRTYKDFERFIEAYPDASIVEMDTVKGGKHAGKCLLTLLFRSCNFMLAILLPRCTQECVIKAINDLTDTIGIRLFRKYFSVILTDNGSEFKNPYDIEKTADGRHRTYVFYCDPYVSNQKARLEKNHEYIRYVIPKGQSMYKYTQDDINLMNSHINSTARDSLNGATPFDLANLLLDKRIPILAGLNKVSPDDVMLKPVLIEKSKNSKEVTYEE